MAYDPARLELLGVALDAALGDLQRIRSDDPAAADAIRCVRQACRELGDHCLPRVRDLLASRAMTASVDTLLWSCDVHATALADLVRDRAWELIPDPLDLNGQPLQLPNPPFGPSLPRVLDLDELEAAIRCGQRVPMVVPTDPGRPRDRQFTTMWFTPSSIVPVGSRELNSPALKLTDVLSNFSMFGWHEHKPLEVFYLPSVAVVSSVRSLDANEGTEYLTAATTSGYLVLNSDERQIDINVPTAPINAPSIMSISVTVDNDHEYSGTFFPDAPPDFRPTTPEPGYEASTRWMLTTFPAALDETGRWVADSSKLRFSRNDDDAQCTACTSTG